MAFAPAFPRWRRPLALVGAGVGIVAFAVFWDGQTKFLLKEGITGAIVSIALLVSALLFPRAFGGDIGFGAAAFGKRFRMYSIVTMAILIIFGALVGVEAPNVGKNLPTPWIEIWERINIGVFMLWVIVLAIAVLRVPQNYEVCTMRPIAAS